MKERKERLIIEENAFYEIDEECLRKKQKKEAQESELLMKRNRRQR